MNITIPHDVGDEVWFWSPNLGNLEPIKLVVSAITIWIDPRWDEPKIEYRLSNWPNSHSGLTSQEAVFATYDGAIAYRDGWIKTSGFLTPP